MPSSSAAALELRQRARSLRRLSQRMQRCSAIDLIRFAGDDTWLGPSPQRCADDLRWLRVSFLQQADELEATARCLERQADELDAIASSPPLVR